MVSLLQTPSNGPTSPQGDWGGGGEIFLNASGIV